MNLEYACGNWTKETLKKDEKETKRKEKGREKTNLVSNQWAKGFGRFDGKRNRSIFEIRDDDDDDDDRREKRRRKREWNRHFTTSTTRRSEAEGNIYARRGRLSGSKLEKKRKRRGGVGRAVATIASLPMIKLDGLYDGCTRRRWEAASPV